MQQLAELKEEIRRLSDRLNDYRDEVREDHAQQMGKLETIHRVIIERKAS